MSGEGNGTPLQYSCLENPMDGGAWWAAVHGVTTEQLHFHFSLSCIGEGNGNPLQCSCLENPRDGGVCGITQSRTRLKWLSSSNYCVLFNTILGDILGSYLKPPLDPNLIFWQNPNLVQSCKTMWPGKMMDLYQFKLAIGEIRSPYHWLVWGKSFYCVVTSELWSRLNVGSWEGCF